MIILWRLRGKWERCYNLFWKNNHFKDIKGVFKCLCSSNIKVSWTIKFIYIFLKMFSLNYIITQICPTWVFDLHVFILPIRFISFWFLNITKSIRYLLSVYQILIFNGSILYFNNKKMFSKQIHDLSNNLPENKKERVMNRRWRER